MGPVRDEDVSGKASSDASAVEAAIADIWRDLLAVDEIEPGWDFFDLGGSSFDLLRLRSRILETWGVKLPLIVLFECRTVESMAAAVLAGPRTVRRRSGGVRAGRSLRASFAQEERLWRDQYAAVHGLPLGAFHVVAAHRLSGACDSGLLKAALEVVVGRHDALRTSFHWAGTHFEQRLNAVMPLDFECLDLRNEREGWSALLDEYLQVAATSPFDTSTSQLIRARLVTLPDDSAVLLIAVDHLISDAWSLRIIEGEISEVYNELVAGKLPSTDLQEPRFADFIQQERQHGSNSPALDHLLAFWRKQLADGSLVPRIDSGAGPWKGALDFSGQRVIHRLPRGRIDAFLRICGEQGGTLLSGVIAAVAVGLREMTGRESVGAIVAVANRPGPEWDRCVGAFANMLLVRVDLADCTDLREILARSHAAAIAAYEHAIPFAELIEQLEPRRYGRPDRTPPFCFLSVVEGDGASGLTILSAEPMFVDTKMNFLGVSLWFRLRRDEMSLVCGYGTRHTARETVDRFLTTVTDTLVTAKGIGAERRNNPC